VRTVWKIALPVNVLTASATNTFRLPEDARLVHVREQKDAIALWFEVEDHGVMVPRSFQIFGTGTGPIRDGLEYRGTGIFAGGDLVLHVYEVMTDTL
jgi:hypothetical protein